jgi:hypothetical protein
VSGATTTAAPGSSGRTSLSNGVSSSGASASDIAAQEKLRNDSALAASLAVSAVAAALVIGAVSVIIFKYPSVPAA